VVDDDLAAQQFDLVAELALLRLDPAFSEDYVDCFLARGAWQRANGRAAEMASIPEVQTDAVLPDLALSSERGRTLGRAVSLRQPGIDD
jgi:hypothetical protein